jgi:hypothetical protein
MVGVAVLVLSVSNLLPVGVVSLAVILRTLLAVAVALGLALSVGMFLSQIMVGLVALVLPLFQLTGQPLLRVS